MTQTLIPHTGAQGSHPSPRPLIATRPVLSLHGSEPETGIPMTWHVTLLGDDTTGSYLIERADGDIHSPAVWMQAHREAFVVGEAEVLELVRTVMFTAE